MPDRRDAERNRKVGRVLPDRRVAIVHQLVAVVAKHLAKIIQLRPRRMARRTRQTVLSREGRYRLHSWYRHRARRGATTTKDRQDQHPSDEHRIHNHHFQDVRTYRKPARHRTSYSMHWGTDSDP